MTSVTMRRDSGCRPPAFLEFYFGTEGELRVRRSPRQAALRFSPALFAGMPFSSTHPRL